MRTTLSTFFGLTLGAMLLCPASAQTTDSGTSRQTTRSGGTTSSNASRQTTAGQSLAGTTFGGPSSSIATQTMPAPLATTPPINPSPSASPTLSTLIPQRLARAHNHSLMGTSNSFQNGINGSVESNGVVNGTAKMTPPPLAAPTTGSRSQTNGPANAPGTAAAPTPAASTGQ